ncbi:MAG: hypothetical protein K6E87_03060 [bacterium]|nr:hypothetical protein [bacterium]
MSRRKRYLNGRVFKTYDFILTGHHKHNKKGSDKEPYRMVVALNNESNQLEVKRITKASNNGKNARTGIPIGRYPDIRIDSVVENKTFRKTYFGTPIEAKKMIKTNTRLNRWDREKLGIHPENNRNKKK